MVHHDPFDWRIIDQFNVPQKLISRGNIYSRNVAIASYARYVPKPGVDNETLVNSCHVAVFESYTLANQNIEIYQNVTEMVESH